MPIRTGAGGTVITPTLPGSLPDGGIYKRQGVGMAWTDCNGRRWDLLDRASGAVLMPHVRGTHMPRWTAYTSSSPAVHGQRFRGINVQPRDCSWIIALYKGGTSQDWVDHYNAWWDGLDPERTGVWTATAPDGSSRHLTCRLDEADDDAQWDPVLEQWVEYPVKLVADDPFWRADQTIWQSWGGLQVKSGFLKPVTSTGVLHINSASVTGTGTISNPGDVDAYPVWTLSGPFTSAKVGVGDRAVDIPFAVAAGQTLVIDTTPSRLSAVIAGVDRTGDLGQSTRYAAVPPGANVPLTVVMAGDGRIRVDLLPGYYKAW